MTFIRAQLIMVVAIAIVLDASSAFSKAGEEEWSPLSTTAIGITGDILLSPKRLRMAGVDFPLKVAADIPHFQGSLGPVAARVLRVTRRMNPRLLNGNALCGNRPVRWIAVWREHRYGEMLIMAVYEGSKMPASIHDDSLCVSFTYVRP